MPAQKVQQFIRAALRHGVGDVVLVTLINNELAMRRMCFYHRVLRERNMRVFIGRHHQHRLPDLVQPRGWIDFAHYGHEAAEKFFVGAHRFIHEPAHETGISARRESLHDSRFKKTTQPFRFDTGDPFRVIDVGVFQSRRRGKICQRFDTPRVIERELA